MTNGQMEKPQNRWAYRRKSEQTDIDLTFIKTKITNRQTKLQQTNAQKDITKKTDKCLDIQMNKQTCKEAHNR